jgi:hypothetical protein
MLASGLDAEQARAALDAADGFLGRIVDRPAGEEAR